MLIGGGSGGHIIPLRAVAHEIKALYPDTVLIAVCETGNKFTDVYTKSDDIDRLYQIPAGKYRRYAGQSRLQRLLDFETNILNIKDVFRTFRGYRQARRILKREKPDALLIKGGFVAVPVGIAAARLGIPFITHDSDSTPGLANRLIGRWAYKHATGMPKELYTYPQEETIHTGIPVSKQFTEVSKKDLVALRQQLGLGACKAVITVIGGSQGGRQLNDDIVSVSRSLMNEMDDLGIAHIAGTAHVSSTTAAYKNTLTPDQMKQVVVKGFVDNPAVFTGAADIVVTRASATAIAELSIQKKAIIVVPGQLADSHQHKNADYLVSHDAAIQVASGDESGLKAALMSLLASPTQRTQFADNLHRLAKPHAAHDLAVLITDLAKNGREHAR